MKFFLLLSVIMISLASNTLYARTLENRFEGSAIAWNVSKTIVKAESVIESVVTQVGGCSVVKTQTSTNQQSLGGPKYYINTSATECENIESFSVMDIEILGDYNERDIEVLFVFKDGLRLTSIFSY